MEDGVEELEADLGMEAAEIIKKEYRSAFEKRFQELADMEAPILEEVEKKQAARRTVLSKRRLVTGIIFAVAILPLVGALIATYCR